jgi:chromosome partitioning protein
MRVMALSSQKGGSGKTTLSGHIAVQAELAGAGPVVIMDMDPQGSLSDWWNERQAPAPAFAQTSINRLNHDLEQLKAQGFKLAIIDTPPAITLAIQSVIQVAELIIIPTRPSPHDLRAAGATVELVERAGKPLVFVVNAATPRAKITFEAAVALSQHGTVAPVTIHHRTDFASSMIDGRTVMETDTNGKSGICGAILQTGSKRIFAAPCFRRGRKPAMRRWRRRVWPPVALVAALWKAHKPHVSDDCSKTSCVFEWHFADQQRRRTPRPAL